MLDDDLSPSKRVELGAAIDAGVLAGLNEEQMCDLLELLAAEALFRFAAAPPGRCGLCLLPAAAGDRLCSRHRRLLTTALDVVSPGARRPSE